MIFLILIAIIALIIIALNMKDNANLKTIEDYLKRQNCKNIMYAKGSYKAICDKKLMQIKNSFSVDLEKNKNSFELKDIRSLEEKNNSIIINKSYNVEFSTEKDKDIFYKQLKENISK